MADAESSPAKENNTEDGEADPQITEVTEEDGKSEEVISEEKVGNSDRDTEAKIDSTEEVDKSTEHDEPAQSPNTDNEEIKTTETPDAKIKQAEENKDDEMENIKETKEPIKIDLKLLQSHQRTHSKSSMRHVLTEYGMEDKEHPPVAKKEKIKKKKKRAQTPVEDDAADGRRSRQSRDEKFRQMFGDNRQTDQYYVEYVDFLQKKVEQQRLKAQREKEEQARRLAQQLEEERQKHRYQRKLQRVTLQHDDSFLKDLPRTDMARIVALQDKMRREGKLKHQADVDKFWRDIRNPDTFYAQFKTGMSTVPDYEPPLRKPLASTSDTIKGSDVPPRSLSHISEASQPESWAITQKFASSNAPKTPTGERQRKNSAQLAKEAALDLERRCPKLELPPLACFSLKLKEDPPDPVEIQRQVELKAREKSRKKIQRKLNKMYQMAMTNTAAANRILGQHGDLVNVLEGPGLRDIMTVFDDSEMGGLDEFAMDQFYYPPDVDEGRITEEPVPSRHSTRHSSASSQLHSTSSDAGSQTGTKSKRKKKSPPMVAYPEPLPLSFDEMVDREKTMEPKCLSTNWTNYLHAGKSAFAPS